MINFTGKKNWFFVASVIPMIIGIIFMIINGIPWGIDFTGGSVLTVESVSSDVLATRLKALDHSEAVIQVPGENKFTIQTKALGDEEKGAIQKSLEGMGLTVTGSESVSDGTLTTVELTVKGQLSRETLKTKLADLNHAEATIQETGDGKFIVELKEIGGEERSKVEKAFGEMGWSISSFDSVSDPVAKEKARNAIIGVVIASIAMLLYIWWAFRKVSNPFRYGTCAIIALLHDVFICVAFYSIFADTLNLEINLLFITGLLTVIGYSVNDTVVVFDRVRENLGKGTRNVLFEDVVNRSLTETIARCLITVLTVLLATVAVLLFVGDPIRNFIMVLLVGVASGAYSSIFIASMLLVVWEKGRMKKLSANEAAQKAR